MGQWTTVDTNHTFDKEIRVDEIKDSTGTGAPDFPNGFTTNGTDTFQYTKWTSYTPTTAALGTISAVNLFYRRVGDSLEISGEFTAGTTSASEAQIGIPSGLTIGGPSNQTLYGTFQRDVSSIMIMHWVRGKSGENYLTIKHFSDGGASGNPLEETGSNGSAAIGSGERLSFKIGPIPIQEWS